MSKVRAVMIVLFTGRGALLRWAVTVLAFGLLPLPSVVRFTVLAVAVLVLLAACWRAARRTGKRGE